VVHGKEFVVNADATARHRKLLEAINGGATPLPSALGGSRGGIGQQVITFAPQINVTGGTGSKDQNQELADRIGGVVQARMQQFFAAELRNQMRPGGMLNPA
jgi:hypothetical protein